MLIKQPQVQIVTKPVNLPSGEAALAYFALVNIAGQVEVRFLGTKPLPKQEAPVLLLVSSALKQLCGEVKTLFATVTEPFFSSYEYLVNQRARAPSMM